MSALKIWLPRVLGAAAALAAGCAVGPDYKRPAVATPEAYSEPGPWKEARMANRTRPTLEKRNKERARQEKRKHKDERRANAKVQRTNTPRRPGEEDPDIAGIQPGPQPSPWGDEEA